MKRKIVDTNIVIYYLFSGYGEKHRKAVEVFGIKEKVELTIPVLAEVFYIIRKQIKAKYAITQEIESKEIRSKIFFILSALLDNVFMEEMDIARESLNIIKDHSFDFVDAVLIAIHKLKNREIVTEDQKMNHVMKS